MPIGSTDIEYRLSGGAGNTNPAASLGGAMSTVAGGLIASGVDNNLFDDVSGDEASAGRVEYRGFYIKNNHGTLTWQQVKIWIQALTSSADTEIDIALSAEGVNAAMAAIANETTAPGGGVAFTRPTSKATGLAPGDVPAGQFIGVWIRRTVTAGAAAVADAGTVRAEGDTAP